MSKILNYIDIDNYGIQKMKSEEGGGSQEDLTTELNAQDTALSMQENKIEELEQALEGKIVPSVNLQSKDVSISTNGTIIIEPDSGYDGLSDVDVTVNVSGSTKPVLENGTIFYYSSNASNFDWLADVDTSRITSASTMFFYCSNMVRLGKFDTSNVTNMNQMFYYCEKLESIPLFDTSNVTNMYQMFYNCKKLVTVPLLSTSSINSSGLNYTFEGCALLSNESLNNILRMCINATRMASKNLKILGLTQAQATTCQSLSNWNDFVSAGWTSGY